MAAITVKELNARLARHAVRGDGKAGRIGVGDWPAPIGWSGQDFSGAWLKMAVLRLLDRGGAAASGAAA